MNDLHPTVQACMMRGFCDATFDAAERRAKALDRLITHIHRAEHTGPIEGCERCCALLLRALTDEEAQDG